MMMNYNSDQIIGFARSNPLAYAALLHPTTLSPKHLKLFAKMLMRVESGQCKRLIINVPPRHGKSQLVSRFFPAWFLGKNPSKSIIFATYSQDLSNEFGRSVRDNLESNEHRAIFPRCYVQHGSRAMDRVATTDGGVYVAVGVGGSITGRGADLLLIDDPIKGRAEADSQAYQQALRHWYASVARTRLHPGGAIVVVQTRWHKDDLCGYLLEEHAHEEWEVVNLPAIGHDDQPLWPERYDYDALMQIKTSVGLYEWQCLYQQDPIQPDGMLIKPHWLDVDIQSPILQRYMAIDPAISSKTSADETAISVVGATGAGDAKELETVHGHWDIGQQIKVIQALQSKHKCVAVGVESVAYQKVLGQILTGLGLPVREVPADKDKVSRLYSVMDLFTSGRVSIKSTDLRDQLLVFRGKTERNDMVDAFVHCLRMMRHDLDILYEQNRNIKGPPPDKIDSQGEWFRRTMEQYHKNIRQNSENSVEFSTPSFENDKYF